MSIHVPNGHLWSQNCYKTQNFDSFQTVLKLGESSQREWRAGLAEYDQKNEAKGFETVDQIILIEGRSERPRWEFDLEFEKNVAVVDLKSRH